MSVPEQITHARRSDKPVENEFVNLADVQDQLEVNAFSLSGVLNGEGAQVTRHFAEHAQLAEGGVFHSVIPELVVKKI